MSNFRAKNGRFAKKKVEDELKKAALAMLEARKKRSRNSKKEDCSDSTIFEGCRVVNLKEFARNLKSKNCKQLLDLEHSLDENRSGLLSTFTIICDNCQLRNDVSTSGKYNNEGKNYSIMNTTAVLGKYYEDF